jgi:UrcA family protein
MKAPHRSSVAMTHTNKVLLLAMAASLLAVNVHAQEQDPVLESTTTTTTVDDPESTPNTISVRLPEASSTVSVSYADLDLQTKSGARTLLKRLKKAAKHVCGHSPIKSVVFGLYFGGLQGALESCRMQAIEDALNHADAALMKRILGEDAT